MDKPFVSIAVIINDASEYLLIKRARDPYEGRWSFISGIGASMKGLPPEAAVKDEVMYDIGAEFTGEFCFEYPLQDVNYADKVYVFLGRVAEESIRLNPEAATDIKWFSGEELELEEELAFDNKWILKTVRNMTMDRSQSTQEEV